jgi:hypothetical protein
MVYVYINAALYNTLFTNLSIRFQKNKHCKLSAMHCRYKSICLIIVIFSKLETLQIQQNQGFRNLSKILILNLILKTKKNMQIRIVFI